MNSGDYSLAIMQVAAKDPALAAIIDHQHDCIEAMKMQLGQLPNQMKQIVDSALAGAATKLVTTRRARVILWLQVIGATSAVCAAAAAVWVAVHGGR